MGCRGDSKDFVVVMGFLVVSEGKIAKITIPCVNFFCTASLFASKKCCSDFESFMTVFSLSLVLLVLLISP